MDQVTVTSVQPNWLAEPADRCLYAPLALFICRQTCSQTNAVFAGMLDDKEAACMRAVSGHGCEAHKGITADGLNTRLAVSIGNKP